jgi:hypothetical protein
MFCFLGPHPNSFSYYADMVTASVIFVVIIVMTWISASDATRAPHLLAVSGVLATVFFALCVSLGLVRMTVK